MTDWRAELDAALDTEMATPPKALKAWMSASPGRKGEIGLHHDGNAPVFTVTLNDDDRSAEGCGPTIAAATDDALKKLGAKQEG